MIHYCTTHCSATHTGVDYTLERLTADHRARGFRTIGYHWYIRRDGTIHIGRSEMETGAHVKGHNKHNIGICLEGGVDERNEPEDNFTQDQWDAWILLVKQIQGRHGLALDKFKGHRDWGANKACPCFDVQDKLQEILHPKLGE